MSRLRPQWVPYDLRRGEFVLSLMWSQPRRFAY